MDQSLDDSDGLTPSSAERLSRLQQKAMALRAEIEVGLAEIRQAIESAGEALTRSRGGREKRDTPPS